MAVKYRLAKPVPKPIKDRLAVLLIDMQEEWVERVEPDTRKEIIAGQVDVIRQCSKLNIPLFLLEYVGSGETIKSLREEAAKVPRVQTVRKWHDDGFDRTDLCVRMNKLGAKTALLMGINASCCVRSTGMGAINASFGIITAENLIADGRGCEYDDKQRGWYSRNGTFCKNGVSPKLLEAAKTHSLRRPRLGLWEE